MSIDNLKQLSETVTAVANRVLEVATEKTTSGNYHVGYDDVSDLISFEDYLQYFNFIAEELYGREEVLDLDARDDEFDMMCGTAWCKNYENLPDENLESGYEDLFPEPSMARYAEIGKKVLEQMILKEDLTVTLSPEDLSLTKEELAFTRSISGYTDPVVRPPFVGHLGTMPITTDSYETLALKAHAYYDKTYNEYTPSADLTSPYDRQPDAPHPFYVCVNHYGQPNERLLRQYPGFQSLFEQVFSEPSSLPNRCGVIIDGRPALMYTEEYAYDAFHDDPNVHHARVAMLAGYLDTVFANTNVKVTYGIGSGYSEGSDMADELLCIVPADADPVQLKAFEEAYAKVMDEVEQLPFFWDPEQYRKILSHVKETLPGVSNYTPSVIDFPERAAITACHKLGAYIAGFRTDRKQAELTFDREKLDKLSRKFDVTKDMHTLISVSEPGIWEAESELSKRVTLYTDFARGEDKANATYTLSLGQLTLALRQMGYNTATQPATEFLLICSHEDAREIKDIAERLRKQSLDKRIEAAKKQATVQIPSKSSPMKEADREL